jgi:hypothetical protein
VVRQEFIDEGIFGEGSLIPIIIIIIIIIAVIPARMFLIRRLISIFGESSREPFQNWQEKPAFATSSWREQTSAEAVARNRARTY